MEQDEAVKERVQGVLRGATIRGTRVGQVHALTELLKDAFETREMWTMVQDHEATSVLADLRMEHEAHGAAAHRLAEAAARHGLVEALLDTIEAVRPHRREDVARVRLLEPPSARLPTSADRRLLEEIAGWLQAGFAKKKARDGLLRDAGVDRRGDSWDAVLDGMRPDELIRVLEAAGDPEETAEWIAALRNPTTSVERDLTDLRRFVDAALAKDLDDAVAAYHGGRLGEADDALGALIERVAAVPGTDGRVTARAMLLRASVLEERGQRKESQELLDRVELAWLTDEGRVSLARLYALVGRDDKARSALIGLEDTDGARAIEQLLALARGEAPEGPFTDVDVLVGVAARALAEERPALALACALSAADEQHLTADGRARVAVLVAMGLWSAWVLGDPVPDTTSAVRKLDAMYERLAHDSVEAEAIRRCHLEVEADSPMDGETGGFVMIPRRAPWADAFDAAQAANDDALSAFAARVRCGAAQDLVARAWRAREQPALAVEAADVAFFALPGRGQRRLLARALLEAGRWDEARAHIGVIGESASREGVKDTWDLRMHVATGSPLAVLDLARAYAAAVPEAPAAHVWHTGAALAAGLIDEARAAAHAAMRLGPDALSVGGVRVLATAAIQSRDGALARALAANLARRDAAEERSAAQAALLELRLVGLLAGSIDVEALARAGVLQAISVDQYVDLAKQREAFGRRLDELWGEGAIVFDSWAELRQLPVGMVAAAVHNGDGSFKVVCPVPADADPTAIARRRCVVGGLALEVLAGLDLLDAFARLVGTMVVFRDAHFRVVSATLATSAQVNDREAERVDRILTSIDGLPTVAEGGESIDELAVPAVLAWLAREGELPRVAGPEWEPPASGVVLGDGLAAIVEGGALVPLRRALDRRGVPLLVAARVVDGFRLHKRNVAAQRDALGRARALRTWLARLDEAKRLELLDAPYAPDAPAKDAQFAPHVRRALAFREALAADAELWGISAELVDVGLHGHGPEAVGLMFDWRGREQVEGVFGRYHEASPRAVPLSAVVRHLAGARWPEVFERLAIAGYADALGAPELSLLLERYPHLDRGRPKDVLACLSLALRHMGPIGQAARLLTMQRLVVAWFQVQWLTQGASDPDIVRQSRKVLDLVEDLDAKGPPGSRLLGTVVHGLTLASVQAMRSFYVPSGDGTASVETHAPGPRLWQALAEWASERPERRGPLVEGVRRGLLTLPPTLGGAGLGAVAGIVAHCGSPHDLDVASGVLGVVWARPTLRPLLAHLSVGSRGLEAWLEAAVEPMRSGAGTLDGLRCRVLVDGSAVYVPMSYALGVIGLVGAEEAALSAAVVDGAVAARIRAWAAAPSAGTLEEVAAAEVISPWHTARLDPASVAGWSAHTTVGGLRTIAELRALLEEPDDDSTGLPDRFAEDGPWYHGPEDHFLGRRLAQVGVIPGGLLGFGAPLLKARDSAWTLSDDVRRIEAISRTPIAHVGATVVALAILGAEQREQAIGDRRIDLPTLAAQVAVAAMDPDQTAVPVDALVHLEPRLIRACHYVVGSLRGSLGMSPGALSWLSWRLYGWWSSVAPGSLIARSAAVEMAKAAPAPIPPPTADPWHAASLPDDSRELRELAMLEAAVAAGSVGAIDVAPLRGSVIRVLSRPFTDRELRIRRQSAPGPLGGFGLVAPDLAVLFLIARSAASWWSLPPEVRMRWLSDLTDVPPAYRAVDLVREPLSLLWSVSFDRWTEAEQVVISDAVGRRPGGDRVADLLSIGAWGLSGTDELRARALSAFEAHVGDEDVRIVGVWLLAAGVRGELDAAVGHLREVARARGLDEVPLLRHLAWPRFSDHPGCVAQARAVLATLSQEPHLRGPDALADLFDPPTEEGG